MSDSPASRPALTVPRRLGQPRVSVASTVPLPAVTPTDGLKTTFSVDEKNTVTPATRSPSPSTVATFNALTRVSPTVPSISSSLRSLKSAAKFGPLGTIFASNGSGSV